MTLLEKAKAETIAPQHKGRKTYSNEEILDLAIAYGNREINGLQAASVLKRSNGIHTLLAGALLTAFRTGRIRVEKVDLTKLTERV